jgi:hypothetical protein
MHRYTEVEFTLRTLQQWRVTRPIRVTGFFEISTVLSGHNDGGLLASRSQSRENRKTHPAPKAHGRFSGTQAIESAAGAVSILYGDSGCSDWRLAM